ncbi:DNA helicase-2/ATP-dependent DNA helicase PcrA [Bacillus mesophilus]|uniref:DNA 3'-5' helicase n=1 Tax=Bacillus mesophilus TaxID=1808955 RepID=A0A6M0Q857_9BACI|nr:UvrD-helicase domain-containing protein [Bacillus mesophilus]MBM7662102.1 DNA helicase-2/ATP-dependent DNA helicase PcrA [Bacillus mesophilus]NEY72545.1 UvrD-helicase domain-containing protein [Bacillus mesophilus]
MHQRFSPQPTGLTNTTIPYASLADTCNSETLVTHEEHDHYYFRALERNGIYLNQPQIEAVRHKDGPLLTLAGAGSGKTSVLVSRTGYLIQVHQVQPRHILLVTFSKKAADEMKDRIGQLPGMNLSVTSSIQASTFHSFFLTILRSRGYSEDIISSDRYRQMIMKQLMRELGVHDSYQPETLLALFSSYKVNLISDLPSKTEEEKEIKTLFLKYEDWKTRQGKMDFDDILVKSYHLLQETPALVNALQERFQYIMVDEFQDTNLIQYELIKLITNSSKNLFVVGDDDQTIYSFNGARNEFILQFDQEFSNAKTITLDINYRSSDSIVGLGNEVIKHNQHRKIKTLKATKPSRFQPMYSRPNTTDDEAKWIVEDVKQKIESGSHQYNNFAILHRTASNNRAIFEQLMIEKIPFILYSGTDKLFYDHWTVKPLIDYLKLSLDPRHFDAMDGIVSTLYIQREKAMDFIWNKEQNGAKKYPLIHLVDYPGLRSFQIEKVKERVRLLKECKDLEPVAAIKKLRQSFYDKYLETEGKQQATVQKEDIKEMLDELEASAKRFITISDFIHFIEEIVEQHQNMKKGSFTNQQTVSLMTIHKAKGLEFRSVYLIGASEGIIPHITALEAGKLQEAGPKEAARIKIERAIEEERRLAYVGVTRAKEELTILSPAYYRGKKVEVSRFFLEAFQKEKVVPKRASSETVLAWLCSKEGCIAWQRITNYEEAETEITKECPMCKSPMKKGPKEI